MKKNPNYKKQQLNHSLFDRDFTVEKLYNMGNPLAALAQMVDFEMFRPTLEASLYNEQRKNKAGRPPIDCVLMFKIMFLQRYYGLGDKQIQYQIIDRISFREFLGIKDVNDIPDEKTVWAFREKLTKAGVFDSLFQDFIVFLKDRGLELQEGRIIDASFVLAPTQRNHKEENEKIKAGEGDGLWNDKPHKKCHKDIDARWTKKNGKSYYGYKQHTKVTNKTKIILSYSTTPANRADNQCFEPLLDESDNGKTLHLDAGYTGHAETVKNHNMTPIINEKGEKNRPLTDEQKANNRQKSKVRCLVEHVYGFMEGSMGGLVVRTVGLARATANTALTCLTYNIFRYVQLKNYHPGLIKG